MLIEHIFLGFCGLAAGLAVSAGTFAFLIVIGVIPRMIGKCSDSGRNLWKSGVCFFADPDSVRTGASVRVRYFCRDICGKHRGGARGDPEYISDHIPAHGLKGRTLLGHARDGGGKSGGIAVLFSWKF